MWSGEGLSQRRLAVAVILVVAASCPAGVWSYSAGAPDTACSSMTPGHGVEGKRTPSPYSVLEGASSVGPGNRTTVTLRAPAGVTAFKGFLVQARTTDTGKPIGTFYTTDYKYMNCENGLNNAVTHTSPADKTNVVLQWQAPASFKGTVQFTTTFVQQFSTFWVGVTSGIVTVGSSIVITPGTTVKPSSELQTAMANIYDGCSHSKGCFGLPAGCEDSKKCDIMMAYYLDQNLYKFELFGTTTGYVAAGLSSDNQMGSDSVMACTLANGVVDVIMSYNTGKDNEILPDSHSGLSDIETMSSNGQIYCRFTRAEKLSIHGTVYNLKNDQYNFLLAKGAFLSGKLQYHDQRLAAASQSNLSNFGSIESVSELYVTLHGCFMIGAWVGAASCGILVARYYKKTWMRHACSGKDAWFNVHRMLMVLTWCLSMAGFGLIVAYVKDLEIFPPGHNHQIVGFTSICLCFVQPFLAMLRCHPGDKHRPIFNWLHWLVGNSAQILGIAAIFMGLELKQAPKWTWWLLVAFIAYHCLIHLFLSIAQCVSDKKADLGNNVFPLKEMNGSRSPLTPIAKTVDAPGAGFRKSILAIYFLVNWLVTAALIVAVAAGTDNLKNWGERLGVGDHLA